MKSLSPIFLVCAVPEIFLKDHKVDFSYFTMKYSLTCKHTCPRDSHSWLSLARTTWKSRQGMFPCPSAGTGQTQSWLVACWGLRFDGETALGKSDFPEHILKTFQLLNHFPAKERKGKASPADRESRAPRSGAKAGNPKGKSCIRPQDEHRAARAKLPAPSCRCQLVGSKPQMFLGDSRGCRRAERLQKWHYQKIVSTASYCMLTWRCACLFLEAPLRILQAPWNERDAGDTQALGACFLGVLSLLSGWPRHTLHLHLNALPLTASSGQSSLKYFSKAVTLTQSSLLGAKKANYHYFVKLSLPKSNFYTNIFTVKINEDSTCLLTTENLLASHKAMLKALKHS